jgi:hypothetical protein
MGEIARSHYWVLFAIVYPPVVYAFFKLALRWRVVKDGLSNPIAKLIIYVALLANSILLSIIFTSISFLVIRAFSG